MMQHKVMFRRPAGLPRAQFNECVRIAMRAGVVHWVRTYAVRHYEPGAKNRYKYALRSRAYLRRRAGMARRRGVADADLRFSGRSYAVARGLAASAESASIRATAAGNRQQARLKWRPGHPINRQYAVDYVKLTNDEVKEMRKVARGVFRKEIKARMRRAGKVTENF